jgi:hypothetical protein
MCFSQQKIAGIHIKKCLPKVKARYKAKDFVFSIYLFATEHSLVYVDFRKGLCLILTRLNRKYKVGSVCTCSPYLSPLCK